MNHEPESNRDQLDQILDASLARYNRAAEPRGGLEDRILANLRSQPAAATSGWFSWRRFNRNWMAASAVAIAAVMLVAVLLMPRTQRQQPSPIVATNNNAVPIGSRSNPSQPTTSGAASALNPTPRGKAAKGWGTPRVAAKHYASAGNSAPIQQVAVAAAVPHLDVFPSPTPLSVQERMLLSYVRRTPREVMVAVSEEQQLHEQEWMQGMQAMQPQQRSEQKSENLK